MPLINCKVELSLKWYENCILSSAGTAATFTITDTKLYVPVVTLKTEDNTKLSKLLTEGFKRSVYWNEYKVIPEKRYNTDLIGPSWQGISRLFVLAYLIDVTSTVNSQRKYFLPRAEIKNYNIKIDGRNFYDQLINDLIKQYDKVRKISTGQGDDYTIGCLLDFAYFKKQLQTNRCWFTALNKQKVLDADLRAIQQIIFIGKTSQATIIYYIYEKSKESILQFSKGTTKVL